MNVKKIVKSILPLALLKPIQKSRENRFFRQSYYKKQHPILSRNTKLKDIYKNKRCFVIGNGPSINQMDLLKLKHEYVFTLNHFYRHNQIDLISPSFYTLIEPLEILQNTHGTKGTYEIFKQIETFYANQKTLFFFNIDAQNYLEKNNLFKNRNIFYLASATKCAIENNICEKVGFDISKPISFMHGALFAALACSAYLGFKKIYLIGCDFDHIIQKNEVHFYKKKVKSHLEGASNLKLAQNLVSYLTHMEKLKTFFLKHEIETYNAGIGGFTDTFERVNFDSLFLKIDEKQQ